MLDPDAGEALFERRSKARFKRRLQERLQCDDRLHSYCYKSNDGTHIRMGDVAIDEWVSALHNGEATLLVPPVTLRLGKSDISDEKTAETATVRSTTSNSTSQHQRPFRLQGYYSLTDIRSAKVSLASSAASSSSLSIMPGIGYLSGKAVKWIGEQIINCFVPLEIQRRRWMIRRLLKRFDHLDPQDVGTFVTRNERTIHRALTDILELSSDGYKLRHRKTAIEQGILLKDVIEAGMFELNSSQRISLNSLATKVFPLYLLSAPLQPCHALAADLRETLLQDASYIPDEDMTGEFAAQLCFHLAYGPLLPWRDEGFATLWYIYQTPHGKRTLLAIGREGTVLSDLACRTFESGHDLELFELAGVVHFFAALANDLPGFRPFLDSATGIRSFAGHIHEEASRSIPNRVALWTLCEILADCLSFQWCAEIFVRLDIAHSLAKLLVGEQRGLSKLARPEGSWISYCLVESLWKISVQARTRKVGFDSAAADELLEVLPAVAPRVGQELGEVAETRTRIRVEELRSQLRVLTTRST